MKQIIFMVLFISTVFSAPNVSDILTKVSFNNKITSDIEANVNMTQQKSGQGLKVSQMKYYRRDSDKSFIIVITAPESDMGNGYLRIDDNFWMYRKNTRTFQHINRDESIGGSDAKGEDFEQRDLIELYGAQKDSLGKEIITEEKLSGIDVYKFKLKAIVNDVSYPQKIFYTRKDNNLLMKEESYSSSGALMATSYYPMYTKVDGKFVAVKQVHVDNFEKGNKTMVEISGISTAKLDGKIFTKAYLENLSK